MEVSNRPKSHDYQSLLSDSEWLVEENEFDIKKINFYETIFTVGNGYLGTRGSLEEGHEAAWPGTYINGLFDHYDSFVVDMVNAPSWPALSIWVNGKKLSAHNCELLEYRRKLDIKKGLLYRLTRFIDSEGNITRYESVRYASLSDRHLFVVDGTITSENYDGLIEICSEIDGDVVNLDLTPAYKEKPSFAAEMKWLKWSKSRHLKARSTENVEDSTYLEMDTLERPYSIGYASTLQLSVPHSLYSHADYNKTTQRARVEAKKGEPVHFQKLTSIYTSRDIDKPELKKACFITLKANLTKGFQERLDEHVGAWAQKWEDCDVIIDGDAKLNNAVRFNIYHLLITANEFDPKANVGAKSLSGEGYRGHIFWDTEIFLLPFYTFTQPETAEALLLYRYHTKEGARDYAKEGNFDGIRYPWESADTGHEVTPEWTADGTVRIWTGERELHITAMVVYAMITYHEATGNINFVLNYGAEILFETTRFWKSRLEYNKIEDRYELNNVEGPDEFHHLVNNSVYTNWTTQWSMRKAIEYYHKLQKEHPEKMEALFKKLVLEEKEVKEWEAVAEKIYIPYEPEKKLIEEFEGYFDLEELPITQWDENNMPVYPSGYNHDNCDTTTLIKQPDVVMLMYILPDAFSEAVKKINYEYYEARTMHKSSLSPSVHTIMGIETNNHEKALQYFERSAYVDLVDNQGNTGDGMHIASAGGTWQALVNGFGGMRVKNGQLTFKPWLPQEWTAIHFKIKWQGTDLKVSVFHEEIVFEWIAETIIKLPILVMGNEIHLEPNQKTIVPL
ncbi:MAG: kojibiose phosphorylase [Dokdonia sp.]|jgi:kojibiose phosphorylase